MVGYFGETAHTRIARRSRHDEQAALNALFLGLGWRSATAAAMEREQRIARQLAMISALPYEEALTLLQHAAAADIAARNPCHCQRIPWRPHLHRFDLQIRRGRP